MKTLLFIALISCSVSSNVLAEDYDYCPEHDPYYDEYQVHVNYIHKEYDRLNYELERLNHREAKLQRELSRLTDIRISIQREKDRLHYEKEQIYKRNGRVYEQDKLDQYLTNL